MAIQVDDGQGGIATQTYTVVVSDTAVEPAAGHHLDAGVRSPPSVSPTSTRSRPPTPRAQALTYHAAGQARRHDHRRRPRAWSPGRRPRASSGRTRSWSRRSTRWARAARRRSRSSSPDQRQPADPSPRSPVQVVTAGLPFRYDVQASDPDGDPITYSARPGPDAGMIIDGLGRIALVADARPTSASTASTVTVDRRPRAASSPSRSTWPCWPTARRRVVNLVVSPNPVNVGSAGHVHRLGHRQRRRDLDRPDDQRRRRAARRQRPGHRSSASPAGRYDRRRHRRPTPPATPGWPRPRSSSSTPATPNAADRRHHRARRRRHDHRAGRRDRHRHRRQPALLHALGRPGGQRHVHRDRPRHDVGHQRRAGQVRPLGPGQRRLHLAPRGHRRRRQHRRTIDTTVNVAGDLKIGNFTLSFTDLSIPVSGIPVTLTRTYDSLNAGNQDELGLRLAARVPRHRPAHQRARRRRPTSRSWASSTRTATGRGSTSPCPAASARGSRSSRRRKSGFAGLFGFYSTRVRPRRGRDQPALRARRHADPGPRTATGTAWSTAAIWPTTRPTRSTSAASSTSRPRTAWPTRSTPTPASSTRSATPTATR